jgi:RNA polymerase sigma-70 factor (ECF subfamily)
MLPMDDSLDSWFKREILVHEAALVRFLSRSWFVRHEVPDLRQDIYVLVYEAAAKSRPHAPKALLFATARNLMIDRIRRKRIVSIDAVGNVEALNVLVDNDSPERRASAYEDLRQLAKAFDQLPPKCRETIWLRRVDDMPQKAVAVRLGVTEKTVEKHVMKGMRLLATALYGQAEERSAPGVATKLSKGSKHGKPSGD